ncbi:hypothetical protein C7N43_02225 [Sphingobacteriales bacterium UPWRP_1]|nr:hypothetical protein B6N25_07305 [Sphingobacteriales bacterium TSM_CSS]PSJ78701.1 hypothetical protein C7N43_02225 [Sphingobacteriales bacterium UPWRP_1]
MSICRKWFFLFCLGWLLLTTACKKQEIIDVSGNQSPYYHEIPTLIVNNYVNKVFIDLIGREPTDEELAAETTALQTDDLSFSARDALIDKLQNSNQFVPVDSSYRRAYHRWFYEQCKARFIEGASIDAINEELGPLYFGLSLLVAQGDTSSADYFGLLEAIEDLNRLISADTLYEQGNIDVIEFSRRMADNAVYDKINMNAFNFVNATFNDFYHRFPTQNEFTRGYAMVEYNDTAQLFGQTGFSKNTYLHIMVSSPEMYEGMIIWAYQTLLARKPTTQEVYTLLPRFTTDRNFKDVQKAIIRTDEYGHFD